MIHKGDTVIVKPSKWGRTFAGRVGTVEKPDAKQRMYGLTFVEYGKQVYWFHEEELELQ